MKNILIFMDDLIAKLYLVAAFAGIYITISNNKPEVLFIAAGFFVLSAWQFDANKRAGPK